MAHDKILTQSESALLIPGRSLVVSPLGDYWRSLIGRVTDEERFAMGSEFNDLEDAIESAIDSGGAAKITLGNGIEQGIGKAPIRIHPPTG